MPPGNNGLIRMGKATDQLQPRRTIIAKLSGRSTERESDFLSVVAIEPAEIQVVTKLGCII